MILNSAYLNGFYQEKYVWTFALSASRGSAKATCSVSSVEAR